MTRDEIIDRWNTQADRFNQWRELSEEEKLEWAMSLEREECAEVAAWILKMNQNDVSAAIRARGNK